MIPDIKYCFSHVADITTCPEIPASHWWLCQWRRIWEAQTHAGWFQHWKANMNQLRIIPVHWAQTLSYLKPNSWWRLLYPFCSQFGLIQCPQICWTFLFLFLGKLQDFKQSQFARYTVDWPKNRYLKSNLLWPHSEKAFEGKLVTFTWSNQTNHWGWCLPCLTPRNHALKRG